MALTKASQKTHSSMLLTLKEEIDKCARGTLTLSLPRWHVYKKAECCEMLEKAEQLIIRNVQHETYTEEFGCIAAKHAFTCRSLLTRLIIDNTSLHRDFHMWVWTPSGPGKCSQGIRGGQANSKQYCSLVYV